MKKTTSRDVLTWSALPNWLRSGLRPLTVADPPGGGTRMSVDRLSVCPLTVAELEAPAPLFVTHDVLLQLAASVGRMPAETGAMLGGSRTSGVVTHLHLDGSAGTSRVTYSPDVAGLNALLRDEWNPYGVNLLGFVHSHPHRLNRPSGGDAVYAERILAAVPELDRLLIPIVMSAYDSGRFSLHPYAKPRHGVVSSIPLGVVPDSRAATESAAWLSRVATAYDNRAMAATRIVAVGAGGSTSFLEDMARAGVGEFVLVDPDVTEEVNLATQHAWPADVGAPKVAALGERLSALNPACRVWTVQAYDHELSDQAFSRLACGVLPGTLDREPATSILCGFTDDFWAQARLSRLALHLGIPYLAAAVYQEGRGLEVAFSVPGVTPACTRCALDRRYEHYLDHGYENAVGSAGTPIVATSRLNALKQLVTLAIVHGTSPLADPEHPATRRHRKVLQRIRDRNLIQVRLDPDLSDHLGISVFDAIAEADPRGRLVLDETVWLQQEPNGRDGLRPVCADCGGTGDLRGSAHAFIDTRQMPRAVGDGRRR